MNFSYVELNMILKIVFFIIVKKLMKLVIYSAKLIVNQQNANVDDSDKWIVSPYTNGKLYLYTCNYIFLRKRTIAPR